MEATFQFDPTRHLDEIYLVANWTHDVCWIGRNGRGGTYIPTLVFRQLFGWNMRIQLFDICLVVVDMFKRLRFLLRKACFIDDPATFLLRENYYENSGSNNLQHRTYVSDQ
jgi:hypothetical protein